MINSCGEVQPRMRADAKDRNVVPVPWNSPSWQHVNWGILDFIADDRYMSQTITRTQNFTISQIPIINLSRRVWMHLSKSQPYPQPDKAGFCWDAPICEGVLVLFPLIPIMAFARVSTSLVALSDLASVYHMTTLTLASELVRLRIWFANNNSKSFL